MKFRESLSPKVLAGLFVLGIMVINPPKAQAFSFSSIFSTVSSFIRQSQSPQETEQKQILSIIEHSNNIVTQLSTRVGDLDLIANTLAKSMSQMAKNGQDITATQPYYDDATTTLYDIRVTIAQATSTIDSAAQDPSSVSIVDINSSLEATFQTAEDQIKTARQDLLNTTTILQNILENNKNNTAIKNADTSSAQ